MICQATIRESLAPSRVSVESAVVIGNALNVGAEEFGHV